MIREVGVLSSHLKPRKLKCKNDALASLPKSSPKDGLDQIAMNGPRSSQASKNENDETAHVEQDLQSSHSGVDGEIA